MKSLNLITLIHSLRRISLPLVATITIAAQVQAADPTVMRLVHVAPLDHQMTWSLQSFATEVKERTGGALVVDVYTKPRPMPDWHEFPKLVAAGELESAAIPNFFWTPHVPEMDVTMIPHFFTRLDQIKKFPHSDAAALLEKKFNKVGVRTLAWLHASRTSVFMSSDKPILLPADLRGRKITAMDPFNKEVFEFAGAAPILLEPYQVAGALKAGNLDSIMTDMVSAVGLQYDTMTKYVTIAPFFSAVYHLFVNPAWMDKLPPQQRQVLLEAAENLNRASVLIWEARAASAPDIFKYRGKMTVHVQTSAEETAWINALQQPAIDLFIKQNPTDGQYLIDAMRKL